MNRFSVSLFLLCVALVALRPARAAEEHDHDHAELPGQAVELSESAQRLIGLACEELQHRALTAVKPLWGRFEPAPEALAQAIAPAAGRVTFHVRPLQRVQAGDLLAEVDAPELRLLEAEITVLDARLATFRALGRRQADLEAQLALAQARHRALGATEAVTAGRLLVRAPQSGVVAERLVAAGAWVNQGDALAVVRDEAQLRWRTRLTAEAAAELRAGAEVRLGAHRGTLAFEPSQTRGGVDGVVTFAPGEATWQVGSLHQAEVVLSSSGAAGAALPVVPERALCRIGLEPVLFLQDPEDADRFVAFPVELGERANGWVQLTNLPPSEHPWRFVARGQYELRLALAQSASGSKPAHFHADGQIHEGED
ncbi:MAG: efflux RND transporter periplasmic adaptor subunit [Candidatus Spyradenecus sp.]